MPGLAGSTKKRPPVPSKLGVLALQIGIPRVVENGSRTMVAGLALMVGEL